MYTISHRSYLGSVVADGTQGPPVYGPVVTRDVSAIYSMASQVPVGNDDVSLRVINSLVLMVPDVSLYKAGDRIALPGDDVNDDADAYRVSKDVRDSNTGPYGYNPGGEIVVERVSG